MAVSESDPTGDPIEQRTDLPRIPGYRIVRRLGLGGMATVYLAVQESLDREVAIKVMRPARQLDAEQSLRFEHEARIIAKLEHPGIVVIHEVGRTLEGDLYYVMPYLAKGDLSMRDFRDDENGLIALLRALLDALGYAHARGIVHRDVKPENVLFDNADRPQLADFGIALAPNDGSSRITGDGLAIGTSAQMSPEQARADPVDGRSDLYSLGVLAYELLTGKLPFQADDPLALALMHAQDPVPRLPAEKAHWQAFINHAMAKRPEQRFRNAQAMQRALEPLQRHVRRAAGLSGRLRRALSHGPAVLVAVGALFAVSLMTLLLAVVRPPAESSPGATLAAATAPADPTDDAQALERALADANERFESGALLEPAGANAAEGYLDVLRLDARSDAARAGLARVLSASMDALVGLVRDGSYEESRKRYQQVDRVADLAQLRADPAFAELRGRTQTALFERIGTDIDAGERERALGGIALARDLGFDPARSDSLDAKAAAIPRIGVATRDPGGPELLFVPARYAGSTIAGSLMMMRNEVTRDEYAAFANATGRAAARCRNTLSPLRIFDRRDWKDPGFRQSGKDPVVCVSLADARAYARWLGKRTGRSYRLPGNAEWLHALRAGAGKGSACALGNVRDDSAKGINLHHACNDGHAATAPAGRYRPNALGLHDLLGNVSEWSAECGSASNPVVRGFESDNCPRHAVLGLSWQDGPDVDARAIRMLPADRGYDSVGFRLVREL
ncbi:MAG TPA: bifunctional serine/threonine-protein kinase/formylglycine-generating enzyme family protein [Dokdonella sp.]|nr:bifunctional serine/threonine-protein kinase/formylglycine-generating enzyme family protein [Dokdonella sp.]